MGDGEHSGSQADGDDLGGAGRRAEEFLHEQEDKRDQDEAEEELLEDPCPDANNDVAESAAAADIEQAERGGQHLGKGQCEEQVEDDHRDGPKESLPPESPEVGSPQLPGIAPPEVDDKQDRKHEDAGKKMSRQAHVAKQPGEPGVQKRPAAVADADKG